MAEEVDQVVHVFDEEHAAFANERQKMYPAHRKCPPAIYDWAKGTVCGCGTTLLGPNPPIGGKGEQMAEDRMLFPVPGIPKQGTKMELENGDIWAWNGNNWYQWFGDPVPQEAEPDKVLGRYHLEGGRKVPITIPNMEDSNHDFAEDMAEAFASRYPHNVHVGIDTGFMMLPETMAVRFLVEGNGIADWVKHFLTKQQDYGDWAGELGARGQFADMYRKWPKIRKAMWEGEPLVGEQLEEVLMDLIGHCFLSLMFLKREKGEFK